MLRICSSLLLITEDTKLISICDELAAELEFPITVVDSWSKARRITQGVVICDSDKADFINEAYWDRTVICLKFGEKFTDFRERFDRYIFNILQPEQVLLAVMTQRYELSKDFERTRASEVPDWVHGDYEFLFSKGRFFYKGKGIFVTKAEFSYLADWLTQGVRDRKKRQTLYKLRKRYGKVFLSDVDSRGSLCSRERT